MATNNICVAGIDPGASGAIAFLFTAAPDMASAFDLPVVDGRVNAPMLASLLKQFNPDMVVIENVHAVKGNGLSSSWNFGVNHGVAIGVVGALHIPTHFVAPTKWKKHFGLGQDKEESRARVIQLWPSRAELFNLKKHHGRAEATLIAAYGVKHFTSEGKENGDITE